MRILTIAAAAVATLGLMPVAQAQSQMNGMNRDYRGGMYNGNGMYSGYNGNGMYNGYNGNGMYNGYNGNGMYNGTTGMSNGTTGMSNGGMTSHRRVTHHMTHHRMSNMNNGK